MLYFRRRQRTLPAEQRPESRRRGPVGTCPDEELVGHIRRILAESPFLGEGYREVGARLRSPGGRTSKERVRRLMREHGRQASQRAGHPLGPKALDGTILTDRPDEMWGTAVPNDLSGP
jgi:putative transposase